MSQRATKKDVLAALATIEDPELYLPITDLGLIYDVEVTNGTVRITMTLTTIGCPLFETIEKEIKEKVGTLGGVTDVAIELTFDPPWSPDNMSESAKAELGIE